MMSIAVGVCAGLLWFWNVNPEPDKRTCSMFRTFMIHCISTVSAGVIVGSFYAALCGG